MRGMGGLASSCVLCLFLCDLHLTLTSDTAQVENDRWAKDTLSNTRMRDDIVRLRRSLLLNGPRLTNKYIPRAGRSRRNVGSKEGSYDGSSMGNTLEQIGVVRPGNDAYSSICNHSQTISISADSASGVIKSPSIRGYYPPNCICRWKILTKGRRMIRLNFTKFDIEFSDDCVEDSLRIYNGGENESLLVRNQCGEYLPSPVTLYSDQALIKFTSNGRNGFQRGFRAAFSISRQSGSVPANSQQSSTSGPHLDSGAICSERTVNLYIPPDAVIKWPPDGTYYPPDRLCRWRIIVPKGQRVWLDFTLLDVETHEDCMADSLWIFDGKDQHSKLVGKFCGSMLPWPLLSSRNHVFLMFTSDPRHTLNRGFAIRCSAVTV